MVFQSGGGNASHVSTIMQRKYSIYTCTRVQGRYTTVITSKPGSAASIILFFLPIT